MKYNEAVLTVTNKDLEMLEQKFKMLPQKAEYETNNYFWNTAGDILKNRVMRNLPRGIRNKSNYKGVPKTHAKDDESLDKITFNLGIKVQTKLQPKLKDFGYLIFPDEGRGKHQSRSQLFFNRSLETEKEKITTGLLEHLNKKIEEEINHE